MDTRLRPIRVDKHCARRSEHASRVYEADRMVRLTGFSRGANDVPEPPLKCGQDMIEIQLSPIVLHLRYNTSPPSQDVCKHLCSANDVEMARLAPGLALLVGALTPVRPLDCLDLAAIRAGPSAETFFSAALAGAIRTQNSRVISCDPPCNGSATDFGVGCNGSATDKPASPHELIRSGSPQSPYLLAQSSVFVRARPA